MKTSMFFSIIYENIESMHNEKLWVQPYNHWRSQNYYKGWTKKIYNTYLYEFT